MQKYSLPNYQISTLLPKSISNAIIDKTSKKSKDKLIKIQQECPLIEQEVEEDKFSPLLRKNNVNKNKNRSSSHEEFVRDQSKLFQNKAKMRMEQNNGYYANYGVTEKNPSAEKGKSEVKQSVEGDLKINFAEEYRLNLRRTVYNQTKMMIKSKRSKLKYSFHTLDQSKPNNTLQEIKQAERMQPKPSLHSQRKKHNSQKLSNIDTMYKTIINNHKIHRIVADCDELEIARFPLIMKSKHDLNFNYSNLLTTMNMREAALKSTMKETKPETKFKGMKLANRGSSRGSVFEKHEIRPWQTFADQFQ